MIEKYEWLECNNLVKMGINEVFIMKCDFFFVFEIGLIKLIFFDDFIIFFFLFVSFVDGDKSFNVVV